MRIPSPLELLGAAPEAIDNAALGAWPRTRSGGFSVQRFRQLLREAASNPQMLDDMSDDELTYLFDSVIGGASDRNPGR